MELSACSNFLLSQNCRPNEVGDVTCLPDLLCIFIHVTVVYISIYGFWLLLYGLCSYESYRSICHLQSFAEFLMMYFNEFLKAHSKKPNLLIAF